MSYLIYSDSLIRLNDSIDSNQEKFLYGPEEKVREIKPVIKESTASSTFGQMYHLNFEGVKNYMCLQKLWEKNPFLLDF